MSKYSIGQSGNPKGRPKGIPDKRVALRALLEPHAAKLVQKVIAKALKGKGDTTALRICLDRLIPTVKPRNETVRFPTSGGTLAERGQAVLDGASEGSLSADEISAMMQAISAQANIVKVSELEQRVAALEEHRIGKI